MVTIAAPSGRVAAVESGPSPATVRARRRIRGYGSSRAYTLGVEEEFQLVDPVTFELVPVVEQLLADATADDLAYVKRELMQSVVEVATPVCRSVDEAAEQLHRLRNRVGVLAASAGARVASAGTSPTSCWEDQRITDQPRYRDIVARLRWIAERELIFGLHVHVGLDCADTCMHVFNEIRADLPLLLALSANSPFWQRSETGLQSSRIKVFDAFPRSGMPAALPGGWEEWEELLAHGARSGLVPDHTFIWWDVRPHPDFGTIEVRICDAQSRLVDTVALVALVQALVAWHAERYRRGAASSVILPQLLIEENRWSAARHGTSGEMIDPEGSGLVPTRVLVDRLLDRVAADARRLGGAPALEHVAAMAAQTGADRQLAAWSGAGGELTAVGSLLVAETAASN